MIVITHLFAGDCTYPMGTCFTDMWGCTIISYRLKIDVQAPELCVNADDDNRQMKIYKFLKNMVETAMPYTAV